MGMVRKGENVERMTLDLSKLFAGVFYCAVCDIFTNDEKKHYHGEVPLE